MKFLLVKLLLTPLCYDILQYTDDASDALCPCG